MTNGSLAASLLHQAQVRLGWLDDLRSRGEFAVCVRIAQECVELALKAALRTVGVDPPKWHDVGPILLEQSQRFAVDQQGDIAALAAASKRLRKERELSFYGDIDFVPTEEYGDDDAHEAVTAARLAVRFAEQAAAIVRDG